MRRAFAASPHLGRESMPALLQEKRILIKRSGVIEYVADSTESEAEQIAATPKQLPGSLRL
jgi:hypothetical protein